MAGGQKRIAKELKDLTESPPHGIKASLVDESDIYRWKVLMTGPEGSPFAGGQFTILLVLPKEYPFRPPTITFITRIYHPNVTQDGQTPTLNAAVAVTPTPTLAVSTKSSTRASLNASSNPPAEPSPTHTSGSMCIGLLRPEEWKPSSRISAVLEFARELMRNPQPDDAVEPRIAEVYRDRKKEWEKKAKEWTVKYAKEELDK